MHTLGLQLRLRPGAATMTSVPHGDSAQDASWEPPHHGAHAVCARSRGLGGLVQVLSAPDSGVGCPWLAAHHAPRVSTAVSWAHARPAARRGRSGKRLRCVTLPDCEELAVYSSPVTVSAASIVTCKAVSLKAITVCDPSSFGASPVNGLFHIENFNLSSDRQVNIMKRAPRGNIKKRLEFRAWQSSSLLQNGSSLINKMACVTVPFALVRLISVTPH